jgi:hypothetical protein
MQTAECPICKSHNPCGMGVFCKVAIGGLIAILRNFGKCKPKKLWRESNGGLFDFLQKSTSLKL